MFRPEFYWWRLVLTLRKLCEVVVALMLSSKPLFQAWCVAPPVHLAPSAVHFLMTPLLLHRTLRLAGERIGHPPLCSFYDWILFGRVE